MTIKFYRITEPYGLLSNFALTPFVLDGYVWKTSEHAYQAYKFVPGGEKFMRIQQSSAPRWAREIGNERNGEPIRSDWDEVRISVMERVLKAKFEQNDECRSLLESTGTERIEEDFGGETFWAGGKAGQNNLGNLLMQLRDYFRSHKK